MRHDEHESARQLRRRPALRRRRPPTTPGFEHIPSTNPLDLNPGDALVIDTLGLRDDPWIDWNGSVLTEAAKR